MAFPRERGPGYTGHLIQHGALGTMPAARSAAAKQLTSHPAADIFPMLGDAGYESLKADILENGQEEDIVLYDGMILDGRNRYRACCDLNIEPHVCEIDSDLRPGFDPVVYVVSKNLHRRHLTESQRGMVAAKIEKHYAPAAKERQKASGGDKKSEKAKSVPVNLPEVIAPAQKGDARDDAAKALNVSGKTVSDAKAVLQHGSPELIAAVERGEVAVSKAAKVARVSPPEIQLEEATAKPKPKQVSEPTEYSVTDDILKFQQLRDKLCVNWTTEKHKAAMRQALRQLANEV